ncbi:MAG: respiratory nitrate reductase subunit gamma [Geodermatophilaceae bacterium]
MALFALWPFTRLVHVFSAPLGYLTRPYIVYRSRDDQLGSRRPRGAAGTASDERNQGRGMNHISLDALAREQLKRAAVSGSGRSAETVVGGHEKVLRRTVIAMDEGGGAGRAREPRRGDLDRDRGPRGAGRTGRVRQGRAGDMLLVPDQRHSLRALEDSAVLLTVAKLLKRSRPRPAARIWRYRASPVLALLRAAERPLPATRIVAPSRPSRFGADRRDITAGCGEGGSSMACS